MSETQTEPVEVPEAEPVEVPDAPAEPEPGPEQPAEQPEQPAEPEQAAVEQALGMSERELEEIQKKLERSGTTWRNRVSEVLGEAAQMLVPCELCDPMIPGFHWPADVQQPGSEMQARLLEVLRNPAAPEYQASRIVRQCGDCLGWGKVQSGSHVPGKELVVCSTCKGNGFQGEASFTPAPPNGDVAEVQFNLPNEQPLVTEDTDVWGSPKILDDGQENPNYGKMPQYKNPLLP